MQNLPRTVVVLGTGGTIAGRAASAIDNVGYAAGEVAVAELAGSVTAPEGVTIETEQVDQIDSKDMSHVLWRTLALRCAHHVGRPEVVGIVVTHGTDTMEETAWFLQRVLAPAKPVVLTGAMRPATSLQADGPQNLSDALAVAASPDACGVVVSFAGRVHGARDVRKWHSFRLDAFESGDAGVIANIEEGRLRRFRDWPRDEAIGLAQLPSDAADWPRVEIVVSHAGADGGIVRAACAAGAKGIVVAATGNGTLHRAIEQAAEEAQASGVRVLRSTRCANGRVVPGAAPDGPQALPGRGRSHAREGAHRIDASAAAVALTRFAATAT